MNPQPLTRFHVCPNMGSRKQYLLPQQPIVLNGVFDHFPAKDRWTFEYFKQKYGNLHVNLDDTGPIGARDDGVSWVGNARTVSMPLGEYVDHIVNETLPRKLYLGGLQISKWFPEITNDLRTIPYLTRKIRHFPGGRLGPRLLLGPAHTVTPLHIDSSHNFLLQFVGRKRVAVFPASQTKENLYIPSDDLPSSGERPAMRESFSPVDYENPDISRYPRYAGATPYETILEPGDCLFLPKHCTHYVRALEPSITLSYWFMSYSMAVAAAPKYISYVIRRLGERTGLVRGVTPQ
jgi:hypothetical protein